MLSSRRCSAPLRLGNSVHLPDRDGSRVVLIGTSEYTDGGLPGLGPVSKNIQAMKDTFTDPVRDIVPATNCRVMLNEGDLRLVGRRLVQAAKSASDLLLVYYSGHGLIGRRSELYLGLRDSDPGEPVFTSLKYDNLRDGVLDSPALTKVIVLDCCFSGRALTGTMADPVDTAIGQTEVKGTYVLTATAMDKVALIRQNEEFTAFSGRLLKILRKGIPDGPELLSADDVFHALDRVMAAEGLPRPRARGSDFAGRLALARNHAYRPQNPKDSADRKAVDGLTYLLLEEGATLAAIAHQRLLEFANDRRQDIAEAAAKALYDARIQPDSSEIDFGRVDQGSAPPLKTVHLAGPRAARICTPRLSHDWIRLDRAGDTLGVSLDTTTRGRLNGTITLEGPTGEAEISVAANVIAVDPAPSQPLQSADPRGNESSAKRSERASQDLPGRPLAGHPNSQNTSGQKSISPPSAKSTGGSRRPSGTRIQIDSSFWRPGQLNSKPCLGASSRAKRTPLPTPAERLCIHLPLDRRRPARASSLRRLPDTQSHCPVPRPAPTLPPPRRRSAGQSSSTRTSPGRPGPAGC